MRECKDEWGSVRTGEDIIEEVCGQLEECEDRWGSLRTGAGVLGWVAECEDS